MEIPPWLLTISGWAYSVLVLGCVLMALVRKNEPSQALGWSLAIVFLPVVGVLAFLILGNRRINRRLARKISHRESFDARSECPAGSTSTGSRESRSESPGKSRWSALSRMLERLGQPPRCGGNATQLFSDSVEAFEAIGQAIREAEHHVHIEFYIFRNDSFGQRLIDLLCEKASSGVEVRVIVDALGSFGSLGYRRRLGRCGGEVVTFLPLIGGTHFVSPNLRNHRKIVVCDGTVAFFGGLNIGREYLGRRRNRGRPWADLHMRVAGPAVADLQRIFAEDWDFSAGTMLTDPAYFPAIEPQGDASMQILAGGPDLRPNPIRQALLAAIARAERRVLIATPYFVPDPGLRDVMKLAARSEVEVTVITQYPPPDHWLTFLCGLFYTRDLNRAGGRVCGYRGGFMHAKAIVIDGEWAMLGTANLDQRSMFLNFEVMAAFDEASDAREIEQSLDALLADSVPYDEEWLDGRPWLQRVLMRPARLLAPLL